MDTAYFNGHFLPRDEIRISPDDRGFLFADGIYEVVKWYGSFFYDIESHVTRLKRSLGELKLKWEEAGRFPEIALGLVDRHNLNGREALVYLQVTRGVARRTHHFPSPEVPPTVYAYAWEISPDAKSRDEGIRVTLKDDIRWSRCDIKSVALLANTISFQDAMEAGCRECIFARDGIITEGSHSNIFFVAGGILHTHPESNHILSGVTRKNIIRMARETGTEVRESAIETSQLDSISEAFITNTSAELTPVVEIGGITVGDGKPGPLTKHLRKRFDSEILTLKGIKG